MYEISSHHKVDINISWTKTKSTSKVDVCNTRPEFNERRLCLFQNFNTQPLFDSATFRYTWCLLFLEVYMWNIWNCEYMKLVWHVYFMQNYAVQVNTITNKHCLLTRHEMHYVYDIILSVGERWVEHLKFKYTGRMCFILVAAWNIIRCGMHICCVKLGAVISYFGFNTYLMPVRSFYFLASIMARKYLICV